MPDLVVVVYDVTSEQSFNSCIKWLERVRAQKPAGEIQLPGITALPQQGGIIYLLQEC